MQGKQEDITGLSDDTLKLRKLTLELELLSITKEQENRRRERNPRGLALNPIATDHNGKQIHVGDQVTLRTSSSKGSAFDNVEEAIVVGWNTRRTDIVIRKIENNGDTTTRRTYNLILKDV